MPDSVRGIRLMFASQPSAWRAPAQATRYVAGRLRWNLQSRRGYAAERLLPEQRTLVRVRGSFDADAPLSNGVPNLGAITQIEHGEVTLKYDPGYAQESDSKLRYIALTDMKTPQFRYMAKSKSPMFAEPTEMRDGSRIRQQKFIYWKAGRARKEEINPDPKAAFLSQIPHRHTCNTGHQKKGSFDTKFYQSRKERRSQATMPKKREPQNEDKSIDVRCGTIESSSPASLTAEAVLDLLPEMGVPPENPDTTPPLLTILLTPGSADLAQDETLPHRMFAKLTGLDRSSTSFESIVAVVDKLPLEGHEPDVVEGLSYILLRNTSALDVSMHRPLQSSAMKPGSLNFVVPANREAFGHRSVPITAQLPLAQTTFTNSLVSTLLHRSYTAAPDSTLELQSTQYLESATIALPFQTLNSHFFFSAPLIPLTPLREIRHVMGNIIRQIAAHPSVPGRTTTESIDWSLLPDDTTMPASEELEKAVTAYFTALGLPPSAVQIWALVLPVSFSIGRTVQRLERLSASPPLFETETIRAAWRPDAETHEQLRQSTGALIGQVLAFDGRLVRVLSGGGGWGKKAGLLSLDPDTQYSTRELRQDSGWAFDFGNEDAEAMKLEALGEIVKEGERIMFLIGPENLDNSFRWAHADKREKSRFEIASRGVTLGAIPSSVDAVAPAPSPNAPVTLVHHPGRFGMLSEGGMAFARTMPSGDIQRTKFDIPGGRLWLWQSSNAARERISGENEEQRAVRLEKFAIENAETQVRRQAAMKPHEDRKFEPKDVFERFEQAPPEVKQPPADDGSEVLLATAGIKDAPLEDDILQAVQAHLQSTYPFTESLILLGKLTAKHVILETAVARHGGPAQTLYLADIGCFRKRVASQDWQAWGMKKRRTVWVRLINNFAVKVEQRLGINSSVADASYRAPPGRIVSGTQDTPSPILRKNWQSRRLRAAAAALIARRGVGTRKALPGALSPLLVETVNAAPATTGLGKR
ncbi:hypothetical protein B0A48_04316 [Cryoendolithus antarcticus]|uniref:Uncharacterized protein n=1 Tax=Cryoendolithus antarcticus TaxID=1507870 RepID=A0A1V8TFE2_9PEZI|nr:hypothetical protein B0A48_04316 [Cryoendolithus antarcticus]